tara:strand:+ start:40 stop:363 length:324 start_codon:yes stop_codon:yes gene_type:complete
LGVRFFFDQSKRKITETFPYIFSPQQRRAGGVNTDGLYKTYIQPFGWLNSLYMLAEKKVFDIDGKNGIDSVKETNLYNVMTYLSWITAKNTFENKVQEKIHNPNKVM